MPKSRHRKNQKKKSQARTVTSKDLNRIAFKKKMQEE